MVGTCIPCTYQVDCEKDQARARARGAKLIESNVKVTLCTKAGTKLKKQRDDARLWGVALFFVGALAGLAGGYVVGRVTSD